MRFSTGAESNDVQSYLEVEVSRGWTMTLTEALAKTVSINIGIEAHCVRRRDRRDRVWYLISARDKLFLVRQDRSGFLQVSHRFASQWTDWRPQTPEDAAREAILLASPSGLRFRNTMMGIIMGPLPESPVIPDYLPDDIWPVST